MPKLKGSLKNITDKPSTIREVLLRATHTRTNGKTITTSEPVRVKVSESGDFTETLAPGAAVLVLVGADFMARESIPLLVAEGMTTIAEAMEAARDFTPDVHDRLAELAAETQKNLEEARGVKAEAESATARMREAAQALKDSVDGSIAEATAGIKKSGSELLASMQALQSKASSSESEAKESAQGAEASRSVALASASSASSSAGEAAESLAGLRAKIEEWKPHGEQLAQWQPQFEWLKENAASGFAKIAELMQDAAAGLRGEIDAKADQSTVTEELAKKADKATVEKQLGEKADSADVDRKIGEIPRPTWEGLEGRPADFKPSAHTHATKEITGLDDALKAKADLSVVDERIRAIPKPVSTWEGLEGKPAKFPPEIHAHGIGDINGLLEQLRGKASESDVSALRARMANLSFAVVDSLPSYPNQNTVYFVR
ncbi:hypothetical protein [Corynebacterium diphtheriae]|uniref:hypothetical protein n=1 Tax=Corynebacterium diphtheriae TaxID=1717 RepID=UPI0008FB419E|nr:hypothetical protein [Corynebacterium diphtheriae]OIR64032.1 hypothetical protein BHF76_01860 [Corynebacterium diphtheriae]OIR64687.1 hypothetical protein BHF73_11445 [Corynebacterium diphtheriae]OIR65374.1 hypothetical protein BHF77_10745 [Corynebacterium diphtheriae]OIR73392.1 hypothetical protein BHF78_08790 [Corynebacterium diphtheriae]OIR81935.1 hypothetical protein BHF81_03605 [Corynebacterium diphtheriae]